MYRRQNKKKRHCCRNPGIGVATVSVVTETNPAIAPPIISVFQEVRIPARSFSLWDTVFLDASIMRDLGTDPTVRRSVGVPKLVSSLVHLDYLLWVVGFVAVNHLVGLHLGHVKHGESVGVGVGVQHSYVALRHLTLHQS